MSTQPISLISNSSSAKVTLVSSTSSGVAASGAAAASAEPSSSSGSTAAAANPRRKVGSNFERAFEQPATTAGPSTSGLSGSRQVLKAGKAVSSAPPAGPNRPMTQLEEAFANRSVQDQRWLLSFPVVMKQLYFNFAESSNHDHILTSLINRFPDLLAGGERTQPAILVAIEKGNWMPALKFVSACAAGNQIKLLRHVCGNERLTYPMLVMTRLGAPEEDIDQAQFDLATQLICSLFKACPELLTNADTSGRNPMHYCAMHCGRRDSVFRPLLQAIRQLCSQQTTQELPGHFGNALVAKDAIGHRADEVGSDNASCRELLRALQSEFPEISYDQSMSEPWVLAIDNITNALKERGKSEEFVVRVSQLIADPRMRLVSNMQDPVKSMLDWFKNSHKLQFKQALVDVGAPDLCCEADRLS